MVTTAPGRPSRRRIGVWKGGEGRVFKLKQEQAKQTTSPSQHSKCNDGGVVVATGLAPRFTPRTHATELNNCPGAGPRALSIRLSRAAASPTHGATPRTPRYVAVFTRPARARTRQLRVGTRRARTVRWGGVYYHFLPTRAALC